MCAEAVPLGGLFPASSMMHPLSSGGYQPLSAAPGGYGMEGQQQSPPPDQQVGSPHDPSNGGADQNGGAGPGGAPHYSDINQILDQILNITDQSLDEAQVGASCQKD